MRQRLKAHGPTEHCAGNHSSAAPCSMPPMTGMPPTAEETTVIAEQAAEGLLREVLEALCIQRNLSLESDSDDGQPARNYELMVRLGIGQVCGLAEPEVKVCGPVRTQLTWAAHNLVAHPLSELCHWAGYAWPRLRDAGNRLHDATVPPHKPGTGRG